jgi:hypothetical protein
MTYAELVQLIEDYVESDEPSFLTHIDQFIALGEERIYRLVKVPAQRQVATSTTTISDPQLGLPNDFLAVDSLSVTVSGSVTYLIPKELNFLKEAYPTGTTGTPRYYCQQDDQTIYLAPTPSAALPVELAYMRKPVSIVSASTTWVGNNAAVALLYACLVEAYTYLKGEKEIIDRYEARLQEAVGGAKQLGEGRDKKDERRNPVTRAQT